MFLGIDFGTSGCRACIINHQDNIVFEKKVSLPSCIHVDNAITQDPLVWWQGLLELFDSISNNFDIEQVTNICINGTSASVVFCDQFGHPFDDALMYNDTSSLEYINNIKQIAPQNHVTLSASSALSKMLKLYDVHSSSKGYMLNQADWLSNCLCQKFPFSDYNNALKMGYDPLNEDWPLWIKQLLPHHLLPTVLAPGSTIGILSQTISTEFGFNNSVNIKLGTTDSIAAFIATGTITNEHAVTSLGSTLVLKQLSNQPINDSKHGIYSHKLGKYWLAGGASNAGGNVMLKYFTTDEIKYLSDKINPQSQSDLNYYPLADVGERFPVNDPFKKPLLTPRPDKDEDFLKGIFEGLAQIEYEGYKKLNVLGAQYPKSIMTCGGGAMNKQWLAIRAKKTQAKIQTATHSEACYGSAILAKYGINFYL